MVLATLFGLPLGTALGALVGSLVIDKLIKPSPDLLRVLDESADGDPTVPVPDVDKPVGLKQRLQLMDCSPWLVQPDYDRAVFINSILTILWPHLSPAIHKEAVKQAKQPLEELCAKVGLLDSIRLDKLDLGSRPFRTDAFKAFHTAEDELIIEFPVFWGGDLHVRVTPVLKVAGRTIDIPLDVSNIQFKALLRVTIRPLVEKLPCVGGVTLSLMEAPHADAEVRIAEGPDLLALPGVPLAMLAAMNVVVGKMLLYPNEFSVPLMPGYGVPPPPQGMLHVKVVGATGLQGKLWDEIDPFVAIEVRKGRPMRTKTIQNARNPTWDEAFDLVVDDPASDTLTLTLKDEDVISSKTVGVGRLALAEAECTRRPRHAVALQVRVFEQIAVTKAPKGSAADSVDAAAAADAGAASAAPGAAPGGDPGTPSKKKGGLFSRLRHKKEGGAGGSPSASAATAAPSAASGASPGAAADGRADSTAASAPELGAQMTLARKEEQRKTKRKKGAKYVDGKCTGILTVEVTYFPFLAAEPPAAAGAASSEGVAGGGAGGEAGAAAPPRAATMPFKRSMVRSLSQVKPKSKGVLTVSLKRVKNLGAALDTYAEVVLTDPYRLPVPTIEFRTPVVFNEASPLYDFTTDFANICGKSQLMVTVYEQPGLLSAVTSLKIPLLQKASAKVLGKVRIPVALVAAEGRVKDAWPLEGAETGEVLMALEWNDTVADEDALEEGGDE